MAHGVCPWWLGYLLASPLRRLVQSPAAILSPFVSEGMTVLEPGPGMGFFTLELARRVGPSGKVIAVDIQAKMLAGLQRRARRAGLLTRIDPRLTSGEGLGVSDLSGKVDFVLAFAMVHEMPDPDRFFAEAHSVLVPGGRLLLSEPSGHVPERDFSATVAKAEKVGLAVEGHPRIPRSQAAVLVKRP